MLDKQWCVYVHENRANGKRYVGITSQKPANRWRDGKEYGPAYGYKAKTPFFMPFKSMVGMVLIILCYFQE